MLERSRKAGKTFDYALRSMDPWTMEVCDELERRLDEPGLIERMADARALSPDGFAERFADAIGIFPEEYLRRIRLARAGDAPLPALSAP